MNCKIIFNVLILLFVCNFVGAQQTTRNITLEDIWVNYSIYPKTVSGFNSMNDGQNYTILDFLGREIEQYSFKTGKKVKSIFNINELPDKGDIKKLDGYSFNSDETKILFATDEESIYRRSSKAYYYLYDLKSKKLMSVDRESKQQLAELSPKGDKIAYMANNNLFIKEITTGSVQQITTDGKQNAIINGAPDWVYEEEFGTAKLFEWSPDGNKLAYVKFNESKVKEFTMSYYGDLYPEQYAYKYPKAGEDNSIVSVHVYDLVRKKNVDMNIGSETNIYIPRIKWTQDPNQLCITRLNRLQNKLDLLFANGTSGESNIILTEENKCYVDVYDDLTFLKDNKHFIWTSERDKWKHIYLYDITGKMVRQITKGDWVVTQYVGMDENTQNLYYISTEQSPIERDFYTIKIDGTGKKKLSSRKGTNDVEVGKNFKYFVNKWSDANTPYYISVNSMDGKEVRVIEDNAKLVQTMKDFNFVKQEFSTLKTSDGLDLHYAMLKPKDFDPNKKYPLYMFLYGGPGRQEVSNGWGSFDYAWHQLLTQNGYVVAIVDNRGTDNRGEDFSKSTYMQMGKLESRDQIEAAKYFINTGFIDKSRIGIQGWSYGGTMAALCLMVGSDVFKSAIAVAPVTNWRYYDNIYSERFMRTPQENPKGYDDYSPINHVKELKGKLLLVHGTADDNVHFQNSVDLVSALVKANKKFDVMYYPNSNHGIYTGKNTRLHLYNKMLDFVLQNL